ncbi:MAG: hypothetical protein ACJ74Q_17055 [Pyrinomonadaceae bacterium]
MSLAVYEREAALVRAVSPFGDDEVAPRRQDYLRGSLEPAREDRDRLCARVRGEQRAPFKGETQTDTLAAIIGKEPPPLARYRADAPESLEWVVTKALTKDLDGRYQTAKEILSDLKRLKQQLEFAAEAERAAARRAASSCSAAGAKGPTRR